MKLSSTAAFLFLLLCSNLTLAEDSIPRQQNSASFGQDSIPAQMLRELTVFGERAWIAEGAVNVIPTKKEKRLSDSPASLIKSMHLPFLKEKDGMIVTVSEEQVAVFINGVRAEEIDISTFWPKEVKRVQYFENPADPRFEGERKVVNFIMDRYELGGVTRVSGTQRIPNYGVYSAASKLVYKKMTYGVMLQGNYERDHRTNTEVRTSYRNLFYDGKPYDEIVRNGSEGNYSRSESFEAAFNARYSTEKTTITHTVSLGWRRNPGSGSNGTDSWSENLFNSNSSYSRNTSRSLTPQITGNYVSRLSGKWYLSGKWSYSYARNHGSSWNRTGEADEISNTTAEDVSSLTLSVMPTVVPSAKWSFQLRADASLDWFSTLYGGSANIRQKQNRQEINSVFKIWWKPNRCLTFTLEPGVSASMWQIGAADESKVNPTLRASARWNPDRKFSISSSFRYYMLTPSASESNPVLVRNSELMWSLGNPHLESVRGFDWYTLALYMPCEWVSFVGGVGYAKTFDDIIPVYTPAPEAKGGLIRKNINANPVDNVRIPFSISGSFLDNNLSVEFGPTWYYSHSRGIYRNSFAYLSFSGSADYTVGNVRLGLEYEGPVKSLDLAGAERSWRHDRWNASVTYGTDNLNLRVCVEDIFNNKARSWSKFTSPSYSVISHVFETGRQLAIHLTYTFGYGKKVDPGIDISGPESVKTSVADTSR